MSEDQAWVDLDADDLHELLVALVGYRFGQQPEKRLDEIRKERCAFMDKFIEMAGIGAKDTVLELGPGCGFGTRALAQKACRVVFDFADSHRLDGLGRQSKQVDQFLEHVGFYNENPAGLAGLMQWNSAKGISAVAKLAGFRKIKRRGHRLLLERQC